MPSFLHHIQKCWFSSVGFVSILASVTLLHLPGKMKDLWTETSIIYPQTSSWGQSWEQIFEQKCILMMLYASLKPISHCRTVKHCVKMQILLLAWYLEHCACTKLAYLNLLWNATNCLHNLLALDVWEYQIWVCELDMNSKNDCKSNLIYLSMNTLVCIELLNSDKKR